MELARQLKAIGLDAFPYVVHYDQARSKWLKRPITVDHESWALTAKRPYDDPQVPWQSTTVLGIPIPTDVVIIDLDTYKEGCSRDGADIVLNAYMPWGQSLIQVTISGGEHHAFRAPDWEVRQGTDLGMTGLDTKVTGKGTICSGQGYQGVGSFGVMRLAHPASLPVLPDTCRALLGVPDRTPAAEPADAPSSPGDTDRSALLSALAHVDPTSRDEWRNTGFALKHEFQNDLEAGFEIWDAWSRGEYWADGCPSEYYANHQQQAWSGFRPTRNGQTSITVGTIFHNAMRSGWVPPPRFDAALAFGPGAAKSEAFSALVRKILEEGADSRKVPDILTDITNAGCNKLQTALLKNELKNVLKSARLLDRDLSAIIDVTISPGQGATPNGLYGKNHTENAQLFVNVSYPGNTLLRTDELWYAYDGKCWVELTDDAMDHQVTMAMLPTKPQKSTINGTYQVVSSIMHRERVGMNVCKKDLVIFQNGVLDIAQGWTLQPHSPEHYTTKIVPYNYDPAAYPTRWVQFLDEVFEGDAERAALLQEWMGYMMSGSYRYQKIMLFIGASRSGKGTIGNILAQLVGEGNFTSASLESFCDDDFLDSLRNKTVAFSGDTAKSVGSAKIAKVIERIKKLSGHDQIDFARKYKSRMSCQLPARLTLSLNSVPRLFDDSEALTGRLLVLPFEVSWSNREEHGLYEVLLGELEGIAIWALAGLERLTTADKFTTPAASVDEMNYIAEAYSPLRAFVEDVCTFDGERVTTSRELYDAYKAWAVGEQEDRLLLRKPFISAFKDLTRGRCRYSNHRPPGAPPVRGFKGVVLADAPAPAHAAFVPKVVK